MRTQLTMPHFSRQMSGMTIPALVLLAALAAGGAHAAEGDPRFGDSSWVAPNYPAGDLPQAEGPRVAPADHERTWETILRTPFRIAFLPLRGVARVLEAGIGRYGDRLVESTPRGPGIHSSPDVAIGGVADIGLGPAITWVGFPGKGGKLDLRASWSTIGRRRVRLDQVVGDQRPVSLRLGAVYDSRPDRHYYGIGNGVPATASSYFLLEETSARAALLLGASPLRQLRLQVGYSDLAPRRATHGSPLLEDLFTADSVPYFHQATHEFLYGISGDFALLDDGRDPSAGVHGRLELQHAAGVRESDPDYDRWVLEGRGYLPVFSPRRVLAVRAVYAGVTPTGATTAIPYYRLAVSDDPLAFAAYSSQRFRDLRLMLVRVEYRWVIWHRVSALALYEWGEVAPRLGAFALSAAHQSHGLGLRMGTGEGAALRAELADGADGIHGTLRAGTGF
jgi:hypothetical protein